MGRWRWTWEESGEEMGLFWNGEEDEEHRRRQGSKQGRSTRKEWEDKTDCSQHGMQTKNKSTGFLTKPGEGWVELLMNGG